MLVSSFFLSVSWLTLLSGISGGARLFVFLSVLWLTLLSGISGGARFFVFSIGFMAYSFERGLWGCSSLRFFYRLLGLLF